MQDNAITSPRKPYSRCRARTSDPACPGSPLRGKPGRCIDARCCAAFALVMVMAAPLTRAHADNNPGGPGAASPDAAKGAATDVPADTPTPDASQNASPDEPTIATPLAPEGGEAPPIKESPGTSIQLPNGEKSDKAVVTPGPLLSGSPAAGDDDSVVLENADTLSQTVAGQWVARGNVRVRYKEYEIVADRADIDTDVGVVNFSGNVVLHGPNSEDVYGGKDGLITVDTNKNTYTVKDASAVIRREALQVGILQPVYVYGGQITGRPDFVDARESNFTTCDFPSPHYYFRARQAYVIPGKRLVGRHVTLYRRKRALITIPYFFVPLDQRVNRQVLAPVIGQSVDEGYYAKFAIAYLLSSQLPGILQVDAMQKKGLGLGFQQRYGEDDKLTRGSGLVSLYHLRDKSTGAENLNASLNHKQKFGTVNFGFNGQMQQNSYYISSSRSKSYNTQLTLDRNVGNLSDNIIANLSISDFGTGTSQNMTTSFNQTFKPTTKETLQTKFNLTDSKSTVQGSSSSETSQLDSSLQYDQHEKAFDLSLLTNKYTSIKNTLSSQFFGGLERLPEVRLTTAPDRLSLLKRFLPKTSRLDFSVGDFIEPSTSTNLKRLHFGVDTGTTTVKVSQKTDLDLGGSFIQRFYSDDTAQYTLSGRSTYRIKLGQKSTFNLGYNYLRPYGYTPFQFDFSGNSNLASMNLSVQETKKFQLTAATGYDFNAAKQTTFGTATPWQTLAVQSLWRPSQSFGLRSSTSYDPNHGQLLDLTNNFQIKGSNGFSLYMGTRYAPQQHKFANLNGQMDWRIITDTREDAGYRIRAIASYNGYTKQYEYQGLALTRMWHDWEASVIYQNNFLGATTGPQITFNLNLRALPTYEPFSIGNYGQAIDTGLGSTL